MSSGPLFTVIVSTVRVFPLECPLMLECGRFHSLKRTHFCKTARSVKLLRCYDQIETQITTYDSQQDPETSRCRPIVARIFHWPSQAQLAA
ncbi:hypothetical protein BD311DRAFT_748803 [Dichomitus squalens]|uniref:Uncharacterized protein n=1 Tax=Dichomitus squalens TaxID=114155 RepID=A0A4Q9N2U3_9APHY|nr:hypothetical protein BD311DRAFT_748803 [Dichomitus squalens]